MLDPTNCTVAQLRHRILKVKFGVVLICLVLCSTAYGQFGGFGGNIGGQLTSGLNRITSALPKVPVLSNVKDFADFAAQSGKTYASAAERTLRENLFNVRKGLVDSTNAAYAAGTSTYELGVNAFADLTNAEFLQRFTGNKKNAAGEAKASQHREASKETTAPVPDAFDWREQGGCTPVKFQGECGSCWSFAVTGAIEGHVFRKTHSLPNLSEQNLIDCGHEDVGLQGCDGGYQEYGFEFVVQQNGIAHQEKYPYVDKQEQCSYKDAIKATEIKGFAVVKPKDEQNMKEVIGTLGPLACSLNGLESLLLYKRGIYADEECNAGEVNHSVLVVGYGSEKGEDYWIVKNSWGDTWGEEGYFRLPRGKNFCGIALECSYPVF